MFCQVNSLSPFLKYYELEEKTVISAIIASSHERNFDPD